MMSLSQVSRGRLAIRSSEIEIPSIGTRGDQGVLNGRGKSGRFERRIKTPAQTITNARSVPILTNGPRTLVGMSPAKIPTASPVTTDEVHGVWNRGWMVLAHCGS